ncbi:uncharacterized protein MONOS_8238 [Monocercomonoides exilis]|uniref:uncharacterized protein n=1 Tax=Monocercomonoides exilis TaxID=2049356 RepID=UPI0035596D1E|nr:hypothetical protein MONOS_8238 [Monocercomonoides exilis]
MRRSDSKRKRQSKSLANGTRWENFRLAVGRLLNSVVMLIISVIFNVVCISLCIWMIIDIQTHQGIIYMILDFIVISWLGIEITLRFIEKGCRFFKSFLNIVDSAVFLLSIFILVVQLCDFSFKVFKNYEILGIFCARVIVAFWRMIAVIRRIHASIKKKKVISKTPFYVVVPSKKGEGFDTNFEYVTQNVLSSSSISSLSLAPNVSPSPSPTYSKGFTIFPPTATSSLVSPSSASIYPNHNISPILTNSSLLSSNSSTSSTVLPSYPYYSLPASVESQAPRPFQPCTSPASAISSTNNSFQQSNNCYTSFAPSAVNTPVESRKYVDTISLTNVSLVSHDSQQPQTYFMSQPSSAPEMGNVQENSLYLPQQDFDSLSVSSFPSIAAGSIIGSTYLDNTSVLSSDQRSIHPSLLANSYQISYQEGEGEGATPQTPELSVLNQSADTIAEEEEFEEVEEENSEEGLDGEEINELKGEDGEEEEEEEEEEGEGEEAGNEGEGDEGKEQSKGVDNQYDRYSQQRLSQIDNSSRHSLHHSYMLHKHHFENGNRKSSHSEIYAPGAENEQGEEGEEKKRGEKMNGKREEAERIHHSHRSHHHSHNHNHHHHHRLHIQE